jgi:hypothetical protein
VKVVRREEPINTPAGKVERTKLIPQVIGAA